MTANSKRSFYIVLFVCVVIVVLFQTRKIPRSFKNVYTAETKYVLYWTPYCRVQDFYLGFGFKPFKTCLHKNCYATSNRSLIPLEKFDALLFHCNDYDYYQQPWIRSPHQRYIFVNMESPLHIYKDLKLWNSYFNWTMTYRTDSDISRKYGYIWKRTSDYQMPSEDFFKNKTKLAAWFVSHCYTPSNRERLVMQIQKFMDVDIYGKCGKLNCTKSNLTGTPTTKCYDMLESQYKFYFSFENSYCKEYATEKLYNILQKNVVPVVYGYGDYNLTAPPNSVINVANFDSVEQLVSYLRDVAADYKKYIKYFEWKNDYTVATTFTVGACQICQKLNEPLTTSIYHDLSAWWGNGQSMCKVNKALPKIISNLL